jgi:teichuronic acid biosynthesis glycosyltransferase TuaG
MTLVTILTPLYNGIEFLEECVDSVINQTFEDWIMLIGINGHGLDGGYVAYKAKKIAEKDKRILVIIQSPEIKGKVDSLNNLMLSVNSEWVCILDCDDKWEPEKLEKQVSISKTDALDAVVIGTQCQYFGELHSKLVLPSGYINPVILEEYNPIINSSAMIRREYCRWEYNNLNYTMEDYWMWTEICLSGKQLYNLPEYLTWHRIHKQSAFNSQGLSNDGIRNRYKSKRHNVY